MFAKIADYDEDESAVYKPAKYISTTSDTIIRGLNFKPEEIDGWTLPVIAFPFNNTLVFNAEMGSNALVGNRSNDGPNEATRFDYPEKYTDLNGRFEYALGALNISIFNKYSSQMTLEESNDLPKAKVVSDSTVFYKMDTLTFLDKDAREQLTFSVQLHHVDTTGKAYINKGFAAHNALVGGPGLNTGLSMVVLNTKPFNREVVNASEIISFGPANFTVVGPTIKLPRVTNILGTETGVSYALVKNIGDANYEVLYWVDEEIKVDYTNKQLFINFTSSY